MISFLAILLNLLPAVLKNIPGISSEIQQIITDVASSASAIIGSGVITQPGITTILASWQGVIEVIQKDPNLPPGSVATVGELEKIVQAVLLQDASLAKSVDWTKFHSIVPVA
jgi:hypothetical protein